MSVLICKDNQYHLISGNKVFYNSEWIELSGEDKIQINGVWYPLNGEITSSSSGTPSSSSGTPSSSSGTPIDPPEPPNPSSSSGGGGGNDGEYTDRHALRLKTKIERNNAKVIVKGEFLE